MNEKRVLAHLKTILSNGREIYGFDVERWFENLSNLNDDTLSNEKVIKQRELFSRRDDQLSNELQTLKEKDREKNLEIKRLKEDIEFLEESARERTEWLKRNRVYKLNKRDELIGYEDIDQSS